MSGQNHMDVAQYASLEEKHLCHHRNTIYSCVIHCSSDECPIGSTCSSAGMQAHILTVILEVNTVNSYSHAQ